MVAVKNNTPVNIGHKIEMWGCSGKWAYIHGKDCVKFKYCGTHEG